MAHSFNLSVGEDGIEKPLEVVPVELTKWGVVGNRKGMHSWRRNKKKENDRRRKRRASRKFTVKDLAEAFADLNKIFKMFENMDPNTKMFSLIERNVHAAYKQIYDNIKEHNQQITMDRQMSEKNDTLTRGALAGPPGGIPEVGIDILGDDSSMCITAPEDLPVGQDVEV